MGSYKRTTEEGEKRRETETQDALLELLDQIQGKVRAGVRIREWIQQKWVAAVDEYNECRYDCIRVRLAAA